MRFFPRVGRARLIAQKQALEQLKYLRRVDRADILQGRYSGRASMVILVSPDGKILLEQRRLTAELYPGYWAMPGGRKKWWFETPKGTAKRELKEEVKLKKGKKETAFRPKSIELYGQIIDRGRSKRLVSVFLGKIDQPANEIKMPEGLGFRYFDEVEIRKLRMVPFLKSVLLHYLKTRRNPK